MTINLKIPDVRELKPRITVFGTGGAGGNAVNNMITAGLQGVDFVVANTDAQALTTSKAERIIQMGVQVTEGLGAGSQPEVGRAAAEEATRRDDVKADLDRKAAFLAFARHHYISAREGRGVPSLLRSVDGAYAAAMAKLSTPKLTRTLAAAVDAGAATAGSQNAVAADVVAHDAKIVGALLEQVGLPPRRLKDYPHELSGGQKQRVALARALAKQPKILLLDEPLGALDRKLREELQVELKQLQRTLGVTTLLVTHDQEEALSMSDRIVIMHDGVLQQIGAQRQRAARQVSTCVPPPRPLTLPGPMRILQVVSDTDRRGAQVFATDLEPALRVRGVNLAVVTLAFAVTLPTDLLPLEIVEVREAWTACHAVSPGPTCRPSFSGTC